MFNFKNQNTMSHKFKYADLMHDEVFKLVFGRESSKEVMIKFLNEVITDRIIIDLEYIDKEMHPFERDSKGSIYDMVCKTNDGTRIIVEVQRRKQPFYAERAIYYSTFQIQRQIEAGAEYYEFLPVYVVNILDFKMDENIENTDVKTVYRLYEENKHSLLTDRITFIFIELAKFKKTIDELDGNILEGMYFCFKNMSLLKEKPKILDHDIFTKIFEVSELLNMDKETRLKIIHNMTTERDLRNQMAYARQVAIEEGLAEGRAEGRAKGIEEGRAEGRAEIIRLMHSKGLSIEEISEMVDMDRKEVESITLLQAGKTR